MGRLHDTLKEIGIGYTGHSLELYRVRLLFCLFAEDASILEYRLFQDLIEQCATGWRGPGAVVRKPVSQRFPVSYFCDIDF